MDHIKINDLSVGDWVMYEGSYRKVALIDGVNGLIKFTLSPNFVGTGGVEPIPITPEILWENKWNPISHSDKVYECEEGCDCLMQYFFVNHKLCIRNYNAIDIELESVHQLQHALRLAGITKEIEL